MLYKTQLCSFYAKGICARGNKCSWAHGELDVRPMPKFYKTRMCYTFLSGSYCEASKCTFAHTEEELRGSGKALRLCTKYFLDGYCSKADKCPMAHSINQLDPSVKFSSTELMSRVYNNEEIESYKNRMDINSNENKQTDEVKGNHENYNDNMNNGDSEKDNNENNSKNNNGNQNGQRDNSRNNKINKSNQNNEYELRKGLGDSEDDGNKEKDKYNINRFRNNDNMKDSKKSPFNFYRNSERKTYKEYLLDTNQINGCIGDIDKDEDILYNDILMSGDYMRRKNSTKENLISNKFENITSNGYHYNYDGLMDERDISNNKIYKYKNVNNGENIDMFSNNYVNLKNFNMTNKTMLLNEYYKNNFSLAEHNTQNVENSKGNNNNNINGSYEDINNFDRMSILRKMDKQSLLLNMNYDINFNSMKNAYNDKNEMNMNEEKNIFIKNNKNGDIINNPFFDPNINKYDDSKNCSNYFNDNGINKRKERGENMENIENFKNMPIGFNYKNRSRTDRYGNNMGSLSLTNKMNDSLDVSDMNRVGFDEKNEKSLNEMRQMNMNLESLIYNMNNINLGDGSKSEKESKNRILMQAFMKSSNDNNSLKIQSEKNIQNGNEEIKRNDENKINHESFEYYTNNVDYEFKKIIMDNEFLLDNNNGSNNINKYNEFNEQFIIPKTSNNNNEHIMSNYTVLSSNDLCNSMNAMTNFSNVNSISNLSNACNIDDISKKGNMNGLKTNYYNNYDSYKKNAINNMNTGIIKGNGNMEYENRKASSSTKLNDLKDIRNDEINNFINEGVIDKSYIEKEIISSGEKNGQGGERLDEGYASLSSGASSSNEYDLKKGNKKMKKNIVLNKKGNNIKKDILNEEQEINENLSDESTILLNGKGNDKMSENRMNSHHEMRNNDNILNMSEYKWNMCMLNENNGNCMNRNGNNNSGRNYDYIKNKFGNINENSMKFEDINKFLLGNNNNVSSYDFEKIFSNKKKVGENMNSQVEMDTNNMNDLIDYQNRRNIMNKNKNGYNENGNLLNMFQNGYNNMNTNNIGESNREIKNSNMISGVNNNMNGQVFSYNYFNKNNMNNVKNACISNKDNDDIINNNFFNNVENSITSGMLNDSLNGADQNYYMNDHKKNDLSQLSKNNYSNYFLDNNENNSSMSNLNFYEMAYKTNGGFSNYGHGNNNGNNENNKIDILNTKKNTQSTSGDDNNDNLSLNNKNGKNILNNCTPLTYNFNGLYECLNKNDKVKTTE
ncbi:zinc finger protein, putative [Plasmodium chabaudi chabaudi]|uniref:Zinc finger protein, putative n=1 Tax=Plasmodium chabaudi chabaudi TaxID=31271 RepID=A0A1D3RUC9_PLACU|nr:zinc finger protein, putative [Plasmodium chabaudi chabaudi]